MNRNSLIILLLFLVVANITVAQDKNNDNQLALLYYSQGEYEKATDLYQKLFDESHSQIHFDYLIDCYNKLKELDKAEKITNEQIKRYSKSFYYPVKLATIYQQRGKTKEADEIFDRIVKKATKQLETCLEAGQACLDNHVDSVAKIIYENGQQKYPENRIIVSNLSRIYLNLNENEKLADIYIEQLQKNNFDLDFVENQLQFCLYEKRNPQLKNILIDKLNQIIKKNPKQTTFKELYLWLMIQDKDFEKAFIMSKEIDLEKDEDGDRVYEVGTIALENQEYLWATNCFSYVVQKGPMGSYYEEAMKNLLETSYNKLFKSGIKPDIQQIESLEVEYIKALEELGDSKTTADIIKNLAHIQAFYLNKSEYAVERLKKAAESPNLRQKKTALEMELADIYLFTNDVWGANLLYASIALNNKNNDIGHEAQLKQARVAYFNHNFKYAEALLEVLQGSTSKLIANDALELLLLISDNTALDTSTTALEIFARGDLLLLQGKNNEAVKCYDSIPAQFPGHSLEDDIIMRKADIAKSENNMDVMVSYLKDIEARFPYEIYADKAIFTIASYCEKQGDLEQAKEKYRKLMADYPNSFYAPQARNRYRDLQSR